MLRVGNIDADRSLDGPSDFRRSVPGLLAAAAKAAVVTAARPPVLAALAILTSLFLSVTALTPDVQVFSRRSIDVTLPGTSPSTLRIDADTLFHTVDSDFFLQDDGTMYVQTGDIPAMWLRDSSAQTIPYVRF